MKLTVEDYPGITDRERYPYATAKQIALGKQIARSILKFVRDNPSLVAEFKRDGKKAVKRILAKV